MGRPVHQGAHTGGEDPVGLRLRNGLRLIRPLELEVALPKAIDKISAPLSPAEQQHMYRRTPRLAKSAYYWGWNWGYELVRSAAYNGAILI